MHPMMPLMFAVASSKTENRGRMAEAMLPVMVPGSMATRAVFGVVTATQTVKNEERQQQKVAEEVENLVKQAKDEILAEVNKAADKVGAVAAVTAYKLKLTTLAAFPTLHASVLRFPDIKKRLETP